MPGTLPIKKQLLYLVFLLIAGFMLYSNSIGIPYYSDDYELVFDTNISPFYYFYNDVPNNHFYRPIQSMFLILVQKTSGMNTSLIQITQIGLHALLAFFVFLYMIKFKYSTWQAILGSLYFLIAQTSVIPVAGNDTLSQVTCALFGYMSIYFLLKYSYDKKMKPIFFPMSLLFFTLTLFSKESGVSFLLMIVFILAAIDYSSFKLKKVLSEAMPFIIITIIYLIIRSLVATAQPAFGTTRYQFNLGTNIIMNSVLLVVNVFIPSSSVDLFTAFQNRSFSQMFIPGIYFLIFLAIVALGIWDYYKEKKVIFFFLFLMMVSFFPVIFIGKVSEQFSYNGLPIAAILVGAGFGHLLKKTEVKKLVFAGLILFTLTLMVTLIYSTKTKIDYMAHNGKIATKMLNQVVSKIHNVPENGKLYLVISDAQSIEYSVFLIKEFNYLLDGLPLLNRISNRKDFSTQIINMGKFKEQNITEKDYVLYTKIDKDSVIIY